MLHCQNSKKATLNYQFFGRSPQRVIFKNPPIQVEVQKENTTTRNNFSFNFNGNIENTTYSFTCTSPSPVPSNSLIYLISGTWDDWGTVGYYSTEYGIVKSYGGNPLLVGKGSSVSGTVVNVLKTECYARLTLEWHLNSKEILKVTKDNKIIYQDEGEALRFHEVACDDECPPGHCKCTTVKYPGYCCLPCREVAARINNLVARL